MKIKIQVHTIAQLEVAVVEYEIKPNLVSIVQHDQFGGSTSEDACMHLHNFTELCNMTHIRDYDLDALKLHLFPFSLRGKAKEWLLALPRGFKQEECEPLELVWERMKENIRNCPNHGMDEWLIIHMFYNGLNHM